MGKWTTDYELVCMNCGNHFHATNQNAKFCSEDCKSKYHKKSLVEEKSKFLIENGIENVDYVIDRWNGLACKRIYGGWMKTMHPGKTTADYKKEFPDALICCAKDKENTSKNSGQFMKTPEYRKKYSEMFKGENNPNHSSKTTEQQRKERSPFSKEFYKARGRNEEEVHDFVKTALKDRLTETQLEYWIAKGYNEETAKEMLSERQRTFTLEKCIAKYGEIEGRKKYENRQIQWSRKIEEKYKNGEFSKLPKSIHTSAISNYEIKCINEIITKLNITEYKGGSSIDEQFKMFDTGKRRIYVYDFVYENKVIEFNGDYWHCNPNEYDKNFYNKSLKMTASQKWKEDEYKIKLIEEKGYKVLVIWESEYNDNPEATIQKCIDFIKS